jgi:predicted pyridoxine 5'-phosphate oxidase superfamily flavin-nucleotide-binding protein
MARAFSEIAFTDSVNSMQTGMYGSHQAYSKFDLAEERRDYLGEHEIAFLAERDSFYMSSVGENGCSYIQHREGSKVFLKVLDEKTIGFADYRGSKQYISIGNLSVDNRVSLFIMDSSATCR